MEYVKDIVNFVSTFDIIYLILTFFSLIKCAKQGFVLSILKASKWLFAYLITLFLFPKIQPYARGILDNEYILNLLLGISLFIVLIFLILLINKGIGKTIKYTGLGKLDKIFGFFFGFVRAYVIAVCIFTAINIVYNFDRWPVNTSKSVSFEWVEKGSNYLIKEFPTQKEHEDTKEKIENI